MAFFSNSGISVITSLLFGRRGSLPTMGQSDTRHQYVVAWIKIKINGVKLQWHL
jgi:hypothetical protein